MPKSFTLRGKRYKLSPKVPVGEIKRIEMNRSVTATDKEIRDEYEARFARLEQGNNDYTPALQQQTINYALSLHDKHASLYRKVQTGSF